MLLDRSEEWRVLGQVLDQARRGLSASLVLRGEPGIGKTVLLEHLVESAPDFQVARVVGVESELEFGFGGLHQLLIPFFGRHEQLPVPQRRALRSVFGLETDAAPDHFLVGLATLTLLSAATTDRPLLVVVDDAQWLDQESAGVLAFVARRLHADRIAFAFGVREPEERPVPLEGLPNLWLGRLPEPEGRRLIDSVASSRVTNWSATAS